MRKIKERHIERKLFYLYFVILIILISLLIFIYLQNHSKFKESSTEHYINLLMPYSKYYNLEFSFYFNNERDQIMNLSVLLKSEVSEKTQTKYLYLNFEGDKNVITDSKINIYYGGYNIKENKSLAIKLIENKDYLIEFYENYSNIEISIFNWQNYRNNCYKNCNSYKNIINCLRQNCDYLDIELENKMSINPNAIYYFDISNDGAENDYGYNQFRFLFNKDYYDCPYPYCISNLNNVNISVVKEEGNYLEENIKTPKNSKYSEFEITVKKQKLYETFRWVIISLLFTVIILLIEKVIKLKST